MCRICLKDCTLALSNNSMNFTLILLKSQLKIIAFSNLRWSQCHKNSSCVNRPFSSKHIRNQCGILQGRGRILAMSNIYVKKEMTSIKITAKISLNFPSYVGSSVSKSPRVQAWPKPAFFINQFWRMPGKSHHLAIKTPFPSHDILRLGLIAATVAYLLGQEILGVAFHTVCPHCI